MFGQSECEYLIINNIPGNEVRMTFLIRMPPELRYKHVLLYHTFHIYYLSPLSLEYGFSVEKI